MRKHLDISVNFGGIAMKCRVCRTDYDDEVR